MGLESRVVVQVGESIGDQRGELVHGLKTAGRRPERD
jgi:hypothetical protein